MNIPDQIHFDALDPDDFQFQHWLVTAESETLWEVWALITKKLKEEKDDLENLLRDALDRDVVIDIAPCRTRLDKGKALDRMIKKQLIARLPYCKRGAFKMQSSHDTSVFLTSNSRWGRRSKRIFT